MPRRTTGLTKKEQAERTRRAILDASKRLFSRKGFASTTTQDIARAIRKTPGVLYWHFENKEEILAAVLEELSRRLFEVLVDTWKAAEGKPPREKLNAIIERVARAVETHQEDMLFVGTVGAEVTDTNPRIEEALRKTYRALAAPLAAMMEEAGSGLSDRKSAAELFMGLYMGAIMHQRLFRKELPLERALPAMREMLCSALFPDGG